MKRKIIHLSCLCIVILAISGGNVSALSRRGSRGSEVRAVQLALSELGYYDGAVDGVYGGRTYEAVKCYQSDAGLSADGIAGARTLSELGIKSSSDIRLLARVINGEARGESFEGQVAVGAVVLNRVKHPAFPDTLKEVVYQPGAFSAVDDGQINIKVTDSCIKAAEAALAGADPSGGAVYYYNPDTATCKWIKTRQVIKRIGNHLFCR
ncbi:MAG: spore cortex-lytic enzyme [Clostridia bacterium]|nr:spore cortex-lytic enzyme [Clostridia bacterium]